MQFDKKILNSVQESIVVWNKRGKKLFCNDKASLLYGIDESRINTLSDILEKWDFYDINDVYLKKEELPTYISTESNKEIDNIVLKMVSSDSIKWIRTSINHAKSNGELDCVITTSLDITHLKQEELKYKKIANYDPLTNLPNRLLLSDRLDYAIAHANRSKTVAAVCMIDLDGFKALNDTYGHKAGDTLLVEVSKRMKQVVRADDTVARLGGDEFVVILTDLEKSDDCALTLYRLLNTIRASYLIDGHTIDTISASIGVSIYPKDRVEPEILLRHADVAMYKSKNSGKNKFSFFDIAADQKIKANYQVLSKIKKSLQNNDFCLYYQPKINSLSAQIVEVEALARWNHPLLGLMQPEEFLPLIQNDEELSNSFDEWVIKEVIKQLIKWQDKGVFVKVCINISPRQFKQKDFISKLKNILKIENIDLEILSYIEFEILETSVVENLVHSNKIVKACKDLGITFALDDFGTGYSSLMHLKELNIDTVKIDKTFVSSMLENSEDMAIVQAIAALASAFDITVTAEGAQNIEQVISLMEMGCDEIQGFAIARPMPPDRILEFIKDFKPDPRWKIATHTLPSKADFELLLAESNHKYWVLWLTKELSKNSPNISKNKLNHKSCRFGKWFEKNADKYLKLTPRLKELDMVHQKIHNIAYNTFERIKKQNRVATKNELQEINDASENLIGILDKIRDEIEKIKQQQSVVNKILEKREQYGK
ncbi:MAG: EAL domain-containing protein [Campylobacterota bacterium]